MNDKPNNHAANHPNNQLADRREHHLANVQAAVEQAVALHDANSKLHDDNARLRRELDILGARADRVAEENTFLAAERDVLMRQVAAFQANLQTLATTHANMASMVAELADNAMHATVGPRPEMARRAENGAGNGTGADTGEPIPRFLRDEDLQEPPVH